LAISKDRKAELVQDYLENLGRAQAVIVADYQGMTVATATALRTRLREVDGSFQIVKNTLFKRVLQQAGVPEPSEMLKGPVAVCYCFGEVAPVAKTLNEFARETEYLRIRGGLIGRSIIDAAGAKALADLPPRPIVLAQLVGAIQGPMSSLAGLVAAPLRELARVLQARSEQGERAAA
jgi:large subunit ribosomal protein L10